MAAEQEMDVNEKDAADRYGNESNGRCDGRLVWCRSLLFLPFSGCRATLRVSDFPDQAQGKEVTTQKR